MAKGTLFGAFLNKFRAERELQQLIAIQELWSRNNLSDPQQREGYTIIDTKSDNLEVTRFELWKKVDCISISLECNITTIKEKPTLLEDWV
jgi:hypothetical protein